jgi:hypothetical protein
VILKLDLKMNIKQYPLDSAAVSAALPELDTPNMADEHGMEKSRDVESNGDHYGDVSDLKKEDTAPANDDVQAGVAQAAAITQTWTKNSLRMAYLL